MPRRKATGRKAARVPAPSVSDQIEAELVASALAKRQAGGTPTASERAALRRHEKDREESLRWQHYASIPKRHWVEMSGRPPQTLNQQADQLGLPLRGATLDLREVARAFHDLLATHAQAIRSNGGSNGTPQSAGLERFREERARLVELERKQREGELVKVTDVRSVFDIVADVLRSVGEQLERRHGADARELLDEGLDEISREADRAFPDDDA